MPQSLGSATRLVFMEAPEPGKLHLEFEAAAALKKGQQVMLNDDGDIVAAGAAAAGFKVIGVLIQDVASGERATVATKAFCMIIGRAAGALNAGPVQLGAYDTSNNRPVYAAAAGADDAAKTVVTVGYNVTKVTAAGEIRVILI